MSLNYQITEDEHKKVLTSENYNYVYNKDLHAMLRWGKDKSENPSFTPFGPELVVVDTSGMSMELFTVVIDTLNTHRTITTLNLLSSGSMEKYTKLCEQYDISAIVTDTPIAPEEFGLYALYVNQHGIVMPSPEEEEGVDIMTVTNTLVDIWYNPQFKKFRWEQLRKEA